MMVESKYSSAFGLPVSLCTINIKIVKSLSFHLPDQGARPLDGGSELCVESCICS